MPLNLLAVSENARIRILRMMDNRSIFQLRKVSNSAKDVVDASLLNARGTTIHFAATYTIDCPRTELMIIFDDFESRYLWRTCLNYVTKKLGISRFSFKDSDETNMNNPMTITMRSVELECFLEYLKPHIRKTQIYSLEMHYCPQEIFRLFSAFTDHKSINSLHLGFKEFENIHNVDYLSLVKQCTPNLIILQMHRLNVELFGWLRQLANFAEQIVIIAESVDNKLKNVDVIKSFLDATKYAKCQQLTIKLFQNADVKPDDMEKVLQALHRTDVKVSIDFRHYGNPIRANFGACEMEYYARLSRYGKLTIRHFDKYIDIIKQCMPDHVQLHISGLTNVENIVSLRPYMIASVSLTLDSIHNRFNPMDIIRILIEDAEKTECHELHIRLFQHAYVLHRSNVKVSVEFQYTGELANINFGAYKMEPVGPRGTTLKTLKIRAL